MVVGAGVLGLSVAVELMARGRDVWVVDPGAGNASAVAAGMIAPGFETLLDGGDAARGALLRQAAALWPDFAARTRIGLDLTAAEWRGPDPDGVESRLRALGFATERRPQGVAVPADIRIDAGASMAILIDALRGRILRAEAQAVDPVDAGWRIRTSTGDIGTRQVVLAMGAAMSLAGLPDAARTLIGAIRPIKGQIGWTTERLTDRVLRGPQGYVAPGGGGTLIGATMAEGARDLAVDPAASERLLAMAQGLTGRSLQGPVEWRVGVRGATADGLPLAGALGGGLHVALAPRRNGWLLAPRVARAVVEGIEGGVPDAAFDPRRLMRPAG
ncbi:hypothetical protein BZG35_07095 [Brevundimonas sp. LM2]|nr:hypothetical protein BZG35_07095 [Brevundimonas sp. LM2]